MTAFTASAGALFGAAEWAARATPAKPVIPVLAGLLIDAADDTVTMSGFDYDTRATVHTPAIVATPGRLLVSGRLLASVCKVARPGDDLTISNVAGRVEVTSGRARWVLPTMGIEEYPMLPDPGQPVGTVLAGELRTAIRRVIPATSKDEALPALSAVEVTTDADTLTIAATDRFRLAYATISWKPADPAAAPLAMVVPGDLLDVAAKIGDDTDTVTLTTGEAGNLIGLATTRQITTGRVLDLPFPKWRTLIPAHGDRWARVNVADLQRAMKQASPTIDANPQFVLAVADTTIVVTTHGDDRSARVEIEAETSGEPITICANAAYLDAALRGVASDTATVYFGPNANRPVLWHGDDPDHYQHLLMPVRLPERSAA